MTEGVVISLIGSVVAIISIVLKQHYNHITSTKEQKNLALLITEKDKRQDEESKLLSNKLDIIMSYFDKIEYKRQLVNKIILTCNKIIVSNSIDNTELISLLNNTRTKFIYIIEGILDLETKDIEIDAIKADIVTFSKSIRTMTDFKSIDVKSGDDFCNKLKQEIVMPNISIFTMRLEDEIIKDSNKYNGTFETITLGVINNIITSIIKTYRDCKK